MSTVYAIKVTNVQEAPVVTNATFVVDELATSDTQIGVIVSSS